jgi:quercetin dioxygenase-like cupin family protein
MGPSSPEDRMEAKVVNLYDIDTDTSAQGPLFSLQSSDLNCNFVRFDAGEGVPLHINAEVDVAGLVLEGEGFLQVDGQQRILIEGDFFYLPKGTARKLRSSGGPFAYLSFHARRPCLMPAD